VRSLNKVVDINNYSTEKGRKGGLEQRAIAIGTQGLADVFYLMDYIFTSEDAKKLLLVLKSSLFVININLLADKILDKTFLLQKEIILKFLISIFLIKKIILDFSELRVLTKKIILKKFFFDNW
jgi:hypothetical protein